MKGLSRINDSMQPAGHLHASMHASVQGLAVGFVLLRVEALTEEGKL